MLLPAGRFGGLSSLSKRLNGKANERDRSRLHNAEDLHETP